MESNESYQKLYQWMESFSLYCWRRISFARRNKRTHLFETTLTQDLVFRFYEMELFERMPIRVYESTKEQVNGNDLEIIFSTKFGYLKFCCQCKIMSADHRYKTIKHLSGKTPQIELLINHSMAVNSLPLYIFYNATADNAIYSQVMRARHIDCWKFGSSVLDAFYVYSKYFFATMQNNLHAYRSPHFFEVHTTDLAIPLADLCSVARHDTIVNFLSKPGNNLLPEHYYNYLNRSSASFYSHSLTTDEWDPIVKPSNIIGKIQPEIIEFPQRIYANTNTFAPEYRI